jgi:di/tricarboxylate transporter
MLIDPALLTLVLILVMIMLLVTETFRGDVVALLVLVVLGLTGLVEVNDLFSGFSSSVVITIIAVAIISEALSLTGFANRLMAWLIRLSHEDEKRIRVVILGISALAAQTIHPIIAAGVLIPVITGLGRRLKIHPGRLLIPLTYGVTLGGSAAFLSTWNVIANETLVNAGETAFHFMDFLLIGLPLTLYGMAIFYYFGNRLLPETSERRKSLAGDPVRKDLASLYALEEKLHQVTLLPRSRLAGKTIREGDWANQTGLNIIGFIRDDRLQLAPESDVRLKHQDILLVQGQPDTDRMDQLGLSLVRNAIHNTPLSTRSATLAEIIVAPHATVTGKSIKEASFREKFGLTVLGLWRNGKPILHDFSTVPLQFGDALLVHGSIERLKVLPEEKDWIVVDEDPQPQRKNKRRITLIITALALILAISGLIPIHFAMMIGAVLLVATHTLHINEAYQAIGWRAVFQIAATWPLSQAIQNSGLADTVIRTLFPQGTALSPIIITAMLAGITALLTQFLNSPITVLIMAPFALTIAQTLAIPPQAAVMTVAMSASLSFLTPFGSPTNVIIMSPGNFTFKSFLKAGWPLVLGGLVVILLGIYLFWI